MKIGIFGGTFNPIHKGHINLAKQMHAKLGLDEIWLVPSYKTPNKEFFPEKISPEDRYKMLSILVNSKKYKWLKLNDYEITQKRISYTIDTINHFIKKYPKNNFYLLMGDDAYLNIDTWKNVDQIVEKVKIGVYKRLGLTHEQEKKYEITYVKDVVYNVSSNEILTNLTWDDIPLKVRKYISKKKLYLKAVIFYKLYDTKRFEHSLAVASHAKRLARKYNPTKQEKAYFAGLTHDMFKYEKSSFLIRFISTNSTWRLPAQPVMHGYAAAIWLDIFYQINDKEIINAVKKHTVPDDKMSMLDKIIYVADKISSDYEDEEIKHLRKMAYYNLDETFKKLLDRQYKYLESQNVKIDDVLERAHKKYVLAKKIKKQKKDTKRKNGAFKKIN